VYEVPISFPIQLGVVVDEDSAMNNTAAEALKDYITTLIAGNIDLFYDEEDVDLVKESPSTTEGLDQAPDLTNELIEG
jgi:hypothetical protein